MPEDGIRERPLVACRREAPARIGEFEVRAASNELVGPPGVVRLRPRLMDVLLRLAAEPGVVVPRAVLLDDVWSRRLVADEVLSRTIGELRTVLGDDAREARYIETLPKIGYRLIAPVVTTLPDGTETLLPRPAAAVAKPMPHAAAGIAAPPAVPPVAAAPGGSPGGSATRPEERRLAGSRTRTAVVVLTLLLAAIAIAAAWHLAGRDGALLPQLERQLANAGQFSSDLAMEMSPRFSADGRRVAFALGDPDHARVVVQDIATRTRTMLGEPDALQQNPVFFPDGLRIAYWRRSGSDCAIVERAVQGGPERVLVSCDRAPAMHFDLAPDGRRLVYASSAPGDVGLRLLDLDTGAVSPLTNPGPSEGMDGLPRFSPDGRKLAFLRGVPPQRTVWIMPVDGTDAPATAIGPRGLAWGTAWLGNEGPLLVSADWFGGRALNVLDLRSGKAALAGARGAQFPDVNADGDVVYELASYQANLKLLDVGKPDAPARTLWPSARYTNYPEFAPDGRTVLFLSNRDNAASLFVGTLDGDARRLPLPTDHAFTQAHWSHDGRMLYAVRSQNGPDMEPSRGVRIDPASGRIDVLTELGEWVVDVRESADGSTLYFAVLDGSLMQLWRAPVSSPGTRERLPLPKVDAYDVRGERLAYSEPRARDIVVCTIPQLRCAPAGLREDERRMGWALGDDALWFGLYGEPGELVRFDLASRRYDARLPLSPSAVGPNLAIAPGERVAIVARQEPPAIDLMLAPRQR